MSPRGACDVVRCSERAGPAPEMTESMPLPQNLTRDLVGRDFSLDGHALYVHVADEDLVMASSPCDLVTRGAVTLTRGNRGLWIPYRAQVATYDFLGNYAWAASGPFSGCELAVGQHGDDIYVAHISVESRRLEARNAFATWVRHAPQPMYMAPIRAARQTGNYACYAFVSVAPLEIVRMDVRTRTIGGTDGRIMAIEPLTAPTSSSSRRRRHHSRNSQSRCIIL